MNATCSNLAVSRVLLEDLKQLENINSAAVNSVSSEQLHTVIEIKREWFNMKLDTKKSKKVAFPAHEF